MCIRDSTSGSLAGEEISEEEANLEYSKRTTDMIISTLKEQRNDPDQELLDALNWTKEDLNRFIDRWEKMKRDAEFGDEASQKRFDKELKKLGLRPPGSRTRSTLDGDGKEDYLEDSAVDLTLPELRGEWQAFERHQNQADR